MKPRIALITIFTEDVPPMVRFYRDVLGFRPLETLDDSALPLYVEFESEGVRFAICALSVMAQSAGPVFEEPISGQPFELAFPADSPAEVDRLYAEIIQKGATPIHPPQNMPWNQRTALFADPDGHIHELFANLPTA